MTYIFFASLRDVLSSFLARGAGIFPSLFSHLWVSRKIYILCRKKLKVLECSEMVRFKIKNVSAWHGAWKFSFFWSSGLRSVFNFSALSLAYMFSISICKVSSHSLPPICSSLTTILCTRCPPPDSWQGERCSWSSRPPWQCLIIFVFIMLSSM